MEYATRAYECSFSSNEFKAHILYTYYGHRHTLVYKQGTVNLKSFSIEVYIVSAKTTHTNKKLQKVKDRMSIEFRFQRLYQKTHSPQRKAEKTMKYRSKQ